MTSLHHDVIAVIIPAAILMKGSHEIICDDEVGAR